mmetsp:Transcript_41156/g.88976  ORF Transcript_41156/g.88976 Transcript_41156/m.88976 type:complete len:516 (-) Transcript_41156:535-2082(-)
MNTSSSGGVTLPLVQPPRSSPAFPAVTAKGRVGRPTSLCVGGLSPPRGHWWWSNSSTPPRKQRTRSWRCSSPSPSSSSSPRSSASAPCSPCPAPSASTVSASLSPSRSPTWSWGHSSGQRTRQSPQTSSWHRYIGSRASRSLHAKNLRPSRSMWRHRHSTTMKPGTLCGPHYRTWNRWTQKRTVPSAWTPLQTPSPRRVATPPVLPASSQSSAPTSRAPYAARTSAFLCYAPTSQRSAQSQSQSPRRGVTRTKHTPLACLSPSPPPPTKHSMAPSSTGSRNPLPLPPPSLPPALASLTFRPPRRCLRGRRSRHRPALSRTMSDCDPEERSDGCPDVMGCPRVGTVALVVYVLCAIRMIFAKTAPNCHRRNEPSHRWFEANPVCQFRIFRTKASRRGEHLFTTTPHRVVAILIHRVRCLLTVQVSVFNANSTLRFSFAYLTIFSVSCGSCTRSFNNFLHTLSQTSSPSVQFSAALAHDAASRSAAAAAPWLSHWATSAAREVNTCSSSRHTSSLRL